MMKIIFLNTDTLAENRKVHAMKYQNLVKWDIPKHFKIFNWLE